MTLKEESHALRMGEGDVWKFNDAYYMSYYDKDNVRWTSKRLSIKELAEVRKSRQIIYKALKVMTYREKGIRVCISIEPYKRVPFSELENYLNTKGTTTYTPAYSAVLNLDDGDIPITIARGRQKVTKKGLLELTDCNCEDTMTIGGYVAEDGRRYWVIDYDFRDGTHYEKVFRVA